MTDVPQSVLDMKEELGREERIRATELRVLHSSEDRCSGDLIVEPVDKKSVILPWASVAPDHWRVLFDRYVFEGVEGRHAATVVKALVDGRFEEESRGRLVKWSRVGVAADGDELATSDWTLGRRRGG